MPPPALAPASPPPERPLRAVAPRTEAARNPAAPPARARGMHRPWSPLRAQPSPPSPNWPRAALPDRLPEARHHLRVAVPLDRRRAPHELPPEDHAVQMLALLAFEVIDGQRPVAQLGPWVTPETSRDIAEQRRIRASSRAHRRSSRTSDRRVVPRPGPPHSSSPAANVYEIAVTLQALPRSIAVALRIELIRDEWRVTHLTVL